MTASNGATDTRPAQPDQSIGELLGELSSEATAFISAQIELAKVELREDAQQAARAGGMFGGAAIAAFLAILLLSFAAAWGLAEVVAPGVAFLLVGLVWVSAAAVLALLGRERAKALKEPVPNTIETLKEDAQWVRQQKS